MAYGKKWPRGRSSEAQVQLLKGPYGSILPDVSTGGPDLDQTFPTESRRERRD